MALMDEFREERESVKQKPLKEKIRYILDYYKWPIIGVFAAIMIISGFIYNKVTEKEEILSGLLLNAELYDSGSTIEKCETLSEDFLIASNLDKKKHRVHLNTSIGYSVNADSLTQYVNAQNQKMITTFISAGNVDFITGDRDTMLVFAYQGYFMDLSDLLSEEDYAAYKPYFLYIDAAFMDKLTESKENGTIDASLDIPDWTDPDSMEDPIPVLIDMSQSDIFMKIYDKHLDDEICWGFTCTIPHKDTAVEFLKHVMPEQ